MPDQVFNAIGELLKDWKKTTLLIVALVILYPMIQNVVYELKNAGKISSISQVEHAQMEAKTNAELDVLQKDVQQLDAKVQMSHSQNVEILAEVKVAQNQTADSNFFLQRTCVNTATTNEQREECVKPKWMRQTKGGN